MNEWEFTGEVVSWINESLQKNPSLPFLRAKTEQRGQGSLKRRDLTLLDKNKAVVLTGEIKLPYAKDGNSPYNDAVVRDARSKGKRAGSPYFFTWNVNEFVLWETMPVKAAGQGHRYKSWQVTQVYKESHLDIPPTLQAIQSWLSIFLAEFAQILRGTAQIGVKPPDEKFIDMLESFLNRSIRLNFEELLRHYDNLQFKRDLDKWMRDEQGWIIFDDQQGINDNLERASKFACYALVNKLVFYEALLKRYGTKMDSLNVPEHIDTGDNLRLHLEKYFAEAKNITDDYETVFGEDHKAIGNRIPFYADAAVHHWRDLINQIHKFDFSKLDYEIIGNIFERLISPEERHKYGQFYTRVEVVDLINSFCIRNGDETVLDPACGGGTFLVRAYARKRELSPAHQHGEILSDLFGVDVSHFATHLTTINLATRNLVNKENYPQIARSDFFDIAANKTFLSLPKHIESKGLGKTQHRNVEIPPLDAVVGNPPYVRQEHIPKAKKRKKRGTQKGTKDHYLEIVRAESGVKLSGRSDLHCYFWPHSASFIKKNGYLCLLTSSQWLDVEYGFRLQEWILNNFKIIAVFESVDEPWFVGARVSTAVTILQREKDKDSRMKNIVRFLQLRRSISEILTHDGTTAGAVSAADRFRDEILALHENTLNERYRARLVTQGALWEEGARLSVMMNKSGHSDDGSDSTDSDSEGEKFFGEYYGGKWGIFLRAPDLWFQLLDDYGKNFAPLGTLADIHRGITSGKDSFFFPKDCSSECLESIKHPDDFIYHYGVSRKEVESGAVKLVRCGEGRGEIMPIESCYLEPEVHSLMEIDGFTVKPENCSRLILLVDQSKDQLKGTHVLKYIRWGEKQNYHTGSTCAARVTKEREWYDLTGHQRGSFFWPMAQQYKHVVTANDFNLICNHNLFDISALDGDQAVLGGILNSTWVALSKFQYGRPVGVEGNLKTEVIDTKIMIVPKPTAGKLQICNRVSLAFNNLKKRKALMFLSERRLREMAYTKAERQDELATLSDKCELDMADRRELDDAVLEMLGVNSPQRRQRLIDELYAYLRGFFEMTRQKEEKAIINKTTAKRRDHARPADIAKQIYKEISENEPTLLRQYEADFLDTSKPFDTFDLPADGTAEVYSDMFIKHGVRFLKGAKKQQKLITTQMSTQAELITVIANAGVRGLIRVPHNESEARLVLQEYKSFLDQRQQRIKELIEERTADEDVQEKIYAALEILMPHGNMRRTAYP